MNATLNEDHDPTVSTPGAAFRIIAAIPDTASARANQSNWMRATQDAGFAAIAKVVGHDRSWVSRFWIEETRANLPELLQWFDRAGLRLVPADAEREDDAELLGILLRKTALTIERRRAEFNGEPGAVRMDADEYRALLALARRGVAAMQDELAS